MIGKANTANLIVLTLLNPWILVAQRFHSLADIRDETGHIP
jgi:hypothetical protein